MPMTGVVCYNDLIEFTVPEVIIDENFQERRPDVDGVLCDAG